MNAPSYDDLVDIGIAAVEEVRPELPLNEGDIVMTEIYAGAAMADKVIGHFVREIKHTYLHGAEGEKLDEWGDDRYKLPRQGPTHARVAVTFSRPTADAGAGTIPAGVIVAAEFDAIGDEQRFATLAPVVFGAAATTASAVLARAVVAGPAGNIEAGAVTRIIDTLFDPTITVTNAARGIGGAEADEDVTYQEQLAVYPITVARGTLEALVFGAVQVPECKLATAVEDPDTGILTLYVSDGDGRGDALLKADVETELESGGPRGFGWRAAGFIVNVELGDRLEVNITLNLTVRAGADTNAIVQLVRQAGEARVRRLRIGDTLHLSAIKAAALSVADVLEAVVVAPAADVVPAPNQVIRPGTIEFE